ncbi:hypothetical protein GF337_10665 [candidate division KSB1 bacterium]|nr:hypothetical protein [candidate division KSB1 bacterium]
MKKIKFADISCLFDNTYQLGVLSQEDTFRLGQVPLKGYCHAGRTVIFNQKNRDYWMQLESSLVILHCSDVAYDYTIKPKSSNILIPLFPDAKLITYDFKAAAVKAGLAMRGRNNLVWSIEFGFMCKITAFGFKNEIVDYERPELPEWLPQCNDCSICTDACPGEAFVSGEYQRDLCESVIGPQVQSHLIKFDRRYRRTNVPWQGVPGGIENHCQECQRHCPVHGHYQQELLPARRRGNHG